MPARFERTSSALRKPKLYKGGCSNHLSYEHAYWSHNSNKPVNHNFVRDMQAQVLAEVSQCLQCLLEGSGQWMKGPDSQEKGSTALNLFCGCAAHLYQLWADTF